jgi:hypothetical protein
MNIKEGGYMGCRQGKSDSEWGGAQLPACLKRVTDLQEDL